MSQQEMNVNLFVHLCSKPVPAGSGCCLVGHTVSSGQAPAQEDDELISTAQNKKNPQMRRLA